jgi:hypothetical protein
MQRVAHYQFGYFEEDHVFWICLPLL